MGTSVRVRLTSSVSKDSFDSVQRVHTTFGSSTIRYREPGWVEKLGPELGPVARQRGSNSSSRHISTPLKTRAIHG